MKSDFGRRIFQRGLATEIRLRAPAAESLSLPESEGTAADDVSLETAVREHARCVYEQSGRNQRRVAHLLGISRGKLARHLARLELK